MAFITDTEYEQLLADSEKLKEVSNDIKVVVDSVKDILVKFNLMDLVTSEEKPSKMKVMSKIGGAVSSIMMGHEDLNLLPDSVLEIIKKYTK